MMIPQVANISKSAQLYSVDALSHDIVYEIQFTINYENNN